MWHHPDGKQNTEQRDTRFAPDLGKIGGHFR